MNSVNQNFSRLNQFLEVEKLDIHSVIYYGIGIGVISLATPVAVQALVNSIAFGALFQPLLVLTMILLFLVGFSNVLAALQFYVVDMLQRRLFVRLFDATTQRLLDVSLGARDKVYLPELVNRFLDVVTLQKTMAVLLLEAVGYVLQTLIGMLLLAFYHPLLLAFDLVLIALIAFVLFVLGKGGMATAVAQSKAKYAALAWLEGIAATPMLNGSRSNRVFLLQQAEAIARQYLLAAADHFRILSRQNVGALTVHALANTALLGLGGWMVIERQLSLGQLIAAELVVSAMIYGLTRLGKTLDSFYEMMASMDKLSYLLDLPQNSETKSSLHSDSITHISNPEPYQLDLVNLSLPKSLHWDNLEEINYTMPPGARIAIGSGIEKGSLFDLILGLRSPESGYICINQVDIRDINLRALRDHIVLVREPELITGSIHDNLSLGRSLDIDELNQALAAVGLRELVSALPDGSNTILAQDGQPLSFEECVRLSLARAIASKPSVLMLDKILDRLPALPASAILEYLVRPEHAWTLVLATDNPGLIALCERHIVFEKGKLVEIVQMQREGL